MASYFLCHKIFETHLIFHPSPPHHYRSQIFVNKSVEFIEKWGFEGLDLDWEYPKCWQVDCSAGPSTDKENFAALVRELRAAFDPHGWILSGAVSPSKTVMDEGYDIPALSRDLAIINTTRPYHKHGQFC